MTEAANTQRVRLDDYALEVGDGVAVFLLVTATDEEGRQHGPELWCGTVTGATDRVLVLTTTSGRLTRIPWAAIAAIENNEAYADEAARPPKHPGLE